MSNHHEHIALYWDFENIHLSIGTARHGQEWYRGNRFGKQEALVEVPAIMDYVAGLGVVNINRAYANWAFLHAYSTDLHHHAVDLIQLFPRGMHGKNGADIRLATDVIEDVDRSPHLGTVVIVGGDSDYIAIAQKVKQRGKRIVGIGVKETSNQFWVKSCNEFKFYGTLVKRSHADAPSPGAPAARASVASAAGDDGDREDLNTAKDLLRRAVARLCAQSGQTWVVKAALKPMLMRLDPSFDEADYGFANFSALLSACRDVVDIRQGAADQIVCLLGIGDGDTATPPPPSDGLPDRHRHEQQWRAQQIKLPDSTLLSRAINATWEIFESESRLEHRAAFKDRLTEALEGCGLDDAGSGAAKVNTILWKAHVFMVGEGEEGVSLHPGLDGPLSLRHRVMLEMVRRLLATSGAEGIDEEFLSERLLGPEGNVEEARALIVEAMAAEQ